MREERNKPTFVYRIGGILLAINICTSLDKIKMASPVFYLVLALFLMFVYAHNISISIVEIALTAIPISYLTLNMMYAYDLYASFRYLVFFSLFLIIQLCLNSSNSWHELFFKCIYALSIILVAFTYIQFLFPNFYFMYLFPIFTLDEQEVVKLLYMNRGMVGLTNQTGYNAFLMNLGLIILLVKLIVLKNAASVSKKLSMCIVAIFYVVAIVFLANKRSFVLVITIEIMALLFIKYKFLSKHRFKHHFRIALLLLLVIIVIVAPIILKRVAAYLKNKYDDIDKFSSGRTKIYRAGLSMFGLNPIFGQGMCSTPNYLITEYNMIKYQQMHNIYIQLLAELGIIGFVIFLGIFIYYYRLTLKMVKLYRAFGNKNIIAYMLVSLLVQTSWLVYGLLGNTLTVFSQLLAYIVFASIPIHYARLARKLCINKNNDILFAPNSISKVQVYR